MASLLLAVIYVAFISLGLPDSLLGSAWPTMSQDLNVPVAWAGGISAVISMFTIVSALLSDRMTLKFGAGKVTAVSVALTAAALAGFSVTSNYWVLLAIAIPYGLGAGGVDAALNNYVAIHYESRHMSWLHCMWGVGAAAGPYIMGRVITVGRALNGFAAMKLNDVQMVRMGELIIACGVAVMLLPLGAGVSLAGLVIIGLGCAPVYPCLIHATPEHFGADRSQAVIGIQMACAYVGTSLMPPLFGLIAGHITVALLPVYLLVLLALMSVMHEGLIRKTAHK